MKFGSPASIAGLPGNNACVKVGANRNFGADSSGVLAVSILKRKVNIAVGFNFCVNNAARKRIPFLFSR